MARTPPTHSLTDPPASALCAEPEAIDLLLEVDSVGQIEAHVDEKNAARTCLYLLSCSAYLPEPEDATVLRTAYNCYLKVRWWVAVG